MYQTQTLHFNDYLCIKHKAIQAIFSTSKRCADAYFQRFVVFLLHFARRGVAIKRKPRLLENTTIKLSPVPQGR